VKIVVLTANVDRWLLENATRGGISGVLQKNISAKALLYSLALVMLREKILPISEILSPPDSEDERPEMNGGGNDACHAESRDDLSPREIEILRHLANGLPNKAIARELDVAETTIKAHMKTILRKIKASNRTQAAIWSLTQGRSLNGRSQSDSELFNRELTSEAGLVSWKIAKADSGSHNSSTVRRLTSCAER
jgi:two-component system nitrate/nitrite response regulator NarL